MVHSNWVAIKSDLEGQCSYTWFCPNAPEGDNSYCQQWLYSGCFLNGRDALPRGISERIGSVPEGNPE